MSQHTKESLRQGFTTGSAAAAAAKAALALLLKGEMVTMADIPLPGPAGGRLTVPVDCVKREGNAARAVVVKDAGDDPDATHKARIDCVAEIMPPAAEESSALSGLTRLRDTVPLESRIDVEKLEIVIEGGKGVGRVTLPGLPVPVGQAAINPVPREQIERSAREILERSGLTGRVTLVIEVEDGEAIARHTLNPRLGILGGISILGTQGIVKPFSHDAWKATIDSGLAVARETGLATIGFSTGRRSERMLMAHRPDLPELAFVQAADFFGHALNQAATMGFQEIVWGCFFGKLAKMSQGLAYTHARTEPTDMALLAAMAREAGANEQLCAQLAQANTARHALEILPEGVVRQRFVSLAAQRALDAARSFAGIGPRIVIVCFGFESGVLAETVGD